MPIVLVLEAGQSMELFKLLNLGAADFILAPFRSEDLLPRLLRLHPVTDVQDPVVQHLKEKLGLKQFVGESAALVEEIRKIPKVAQCDASVLIAGETGTGKEMFARAIHYLSPRSSKPFIAVNCGAIPFDLVENELFGHESSAFTGATSSTTGLIHDADSGTLFLDEIDCLPLQSQVKLLRFLQDKEYRSLGSPRVHKADVRVVAASNVDFSESMKLGRLRPDLYYRLNVVPFTLPPLRQRKEDIPMLARHFLAKYSLALSKPPKDLSQPAVQKLVFYDWPGNIRELENILQRAVILAERSIINAGDLSLPASTAETALQSFKVLKAKTIAEFERSYIHQALLVSDGNITKAAEAAKKNRRAFWQLMHKYNISSPQLSAH